MKTVTIESQEYITPSWEEMGELSFELAKSILGKKKRYNRLIGLVKGGLTWSRTLLDYLDIPHLSSFQVKFYQDILKTNNRAIIVQSLPVVVEGENILLFDDVVDSGETVKTAKEYLLMCGAKSVTTASLFTKEWAKIQPDFSSYKTSAWIVFPHEVRETIMLLGKKWKKEKVSIKEIKKRLITIGLPKKQVDYFITLL